MFALASFVPHGVDWVLLLKKSASAAEVKPAGLHHYGPIAGFNTNIYDFFTTVKTYSSDLKHVSADLALVMAFFSRFGIRFRVALFARI